MTTGIDSMAANVVGMSFLLKIAVGVLGNDSLLYNFSNLDV